MFSHNVVTWEIMGFLVIESLALIRCWNSQVGINCFMMVMRYWSPGYDSFVYMTMIGTFFKRDDSPVNVLPRGCAVMEKI